MGTGRLGTWLRVLFSSALISVLLFGGVSRASAATIIFVKAGAAGAHTGTSWANAYTSLQDALVSAHAGQQIWVAAGAYQPSQPVVSSDPRSKTFVLKNGVAIYGGFAGTENLLSKRNPSAYITALSGDIGTTGVAGDNAYHVVTGSALDPSTILDGFTIRGGRANGLGDNGLGGGMFLSSASPTLTNLTFSGNLAKSGGGLWNADGSPTLKKVQFVSNQATSWGGGMYNQGFLSNPVLDTVTFDSNSALCGGGLHSDSAAAMMKNVTFRNNHAASTGGGMFATDFGVSPLTNVTFSGNSANDGGGLYLAESGAALNNVTFNANTAAVSGGGMYMITSSASPTLTNVTFSSNHASDNSGGMYNSAGSPLLRNVTFAGNDGAMMNFGSTPTIYDSILWADGATEIMNSLSLVTIVDSIVKGAHLVPDCLSDGQSVCAHILVADPKLGVLRNNGGFTRTRALGAGSAAIDAGNVTYADGCAGTDQRGVNRPQGGACDIGAYEVHVKSFTSQAVYDGWVSESGRGTNRGGIARSTTTTLRIGDDSSNRALRSFLSFNTASLPDAASVVIAMLKVKTTGVVSGVDPFTTHGSLNLSLTRPYFGTGPGLVASDFQTLPLVVNAGTVGSTLTSDFYTGFLNSTARAGINRLGTTQLRLGFRLNTDNDNTADYLSLYSGNTLNTADQPTLILYYNP